MLLMHSPAALDVSSLYYLGQVLRNITSFHPNTEHLLALWKQAVPKTSMFETFLFFKKPQQ